MSGIGVRLLLACCLLGAVAVCTSDEDPQDTWSECQSEVQTTASEREAKFSAYTECVSDRGWSCGDAAGSNDDAYCQYKTVDRDGDADDEYLYVRNPFAEDADPRQQPAVTTG